MLAIPKTPRSQSVVVVGGGPGSMEVAILAVQAGHRVELYEMADKLGGTNEYCCHTTVQSPVGTADDLAGAEVERSAVTIHLNTEITADSECLKCADQIVDALGALPIVPKIAGIDRENVIEASQAHTTRRNDINGERIVVLGGGVAGCEFALKMAQNGKKATVVEMTGTLAAKGNPENRAAL